MFFIEWKFNALMTARKEFRDLEKIVLRVFKSMLEKRNFRLEYFCKLQTRLFRLAKELELMEYQSLVFQSEVLRLTKDSTKQNQFLETQPVFMLIRTLPLQDPGHRHLLQKTILHYDFSKPIKYTPEIKLSTKATIDLEDDRQRTLDYLEYCF